MDVIEGVIYLAKCAVNEQMPDRLVIESLDLDAVYREAKRHMIASMCGMALKNAGVETEHFKQAIAMAQRKAITLNYERTLVCKALDEAGIWYVPLKGSVIQDWYPKLGMREMGDVDILFDESRAEDVKAIMTSLHYTVDRFGNGHSDDYTKKPLCHFEMHENLFGPLYRRIEN